MPAINMPAWVFVRLCKTKIWWKAKFCYMETDTFIVYIKADDIYKDVAEDVKARFDTSNYELDIPLPEEKKSNWINEWLIRWKD